MYNPIAFDIDGTLVDSPVAPGDWTNPAALAKCRPYKGAFRAVQKASLWRGVVFITGRSEAVRGITEKQLRTFCGVRAPQLYLQDEWAGWDALISHKVKWLQQTHAVALCGDSQIDAIAAERAGVTYLTPEEQNINRAKHALVRSVV